MEEGESIVDAVVREMKEETGLTVLRPQPVSYTHLDVYKRQLKSRACLLKEEKSYVFQ